MDINKDEVGLLIFNRKTNDLYKVMGVEEKDGIESFMCVKFEKPQPLELNFQPIQTGGDYDFRLNYKMNQYQTKVNDFLNKQIQYGRLNKKYYELRDICKDLMKETKDPIYKFNSRMYEIFMVKNTVYCMKLNDRTLSKLKNILDTYPNIYKVCIFPHIDPDNNLKYFIEACYSRDIKYTLMDLKKESIRKKIHEADYVYKRRINGAEHLRVKIEEFDLFISAPEEHELSIVFFADMEKDRVSSTLYFY